MGSILDPTADKFLVTTLTVTLAMNGSMPLLLATLIIGRDAALSVSAFYWRYITLAPPKTFTRFWDFSIPSAEVKPTTISKYNTFLQLSFMGLTTVAPLIPLETATFLTSFQSVTHTLSLHTFVQGSDRTLGRKVSCRCHDCLVWSFVYQLVGRKSVEVISFWKGKR